jgi:hypothetical protein
MRALGTESAFVGFAIHKIINWNPESTTAPESKMWNPEFKAKDPESKQWDPKSKYLLDYLTWGELYKDSTLSRI